MLSGRAKMVGGESDELEENGTLQSENKKKVPG